MEIENMEIGEQQKILAKDVEVLEYRIDEVQFEKDASKKLVLIVKHPDIEKIETSTVKFEKGKKLRNVGLWISFDNDNKLPYNSAVSFLLRHYNCNKIADLKGKVLQTTTDENGFLIVKAY